MGGGYKLLLHISSGRIYTVAARLAGRSVAETFPTLCTITHHETAPSIPHARRGAVRKSVTHRESRSSDGSTHSGRRQHVAVRAGTTRRVEVSPNSAPLRRCAMAALVVNCTPSRAARGGGARVGASNSIGSGAGKQPRGISLLSCKDTTYLREEIIRQTTSSSPSASLDSAPCGSPAPVTR